MENDRKGKSSSTVEKKSRIVDTLVLGNINLNRRGSLDKEMSTELKKMKLAVMAAMAKSSNKLDGKARDSKVGDGSLIPDLNDDTTLDMLAWCSRSNYPKLACLNKTFRSLVKSGYLFKLRKQFGITEHWVYLASFMLPWEAYSPVINKWMTLPPMPCDDCFKHADKESLAIGTELLVFGREIAGFAIWKYTLTSCVWSRAALMSFGRCLFASGSLGSIGIVAGGTDQTSSVLKYAELYDSELGTWETLPDMIMPRKLCSGCFMDGKFYAIGGMSSLTDTLTCGEEYDIETRTWRRIVNMYPVTETRTPRSQCSPPLIAVVSNQLYSADQATNEVKRYNKGNNTWDVVNRLPIRADSSNGWGVGFKGCGNRLLVIGGSRRPHGGAMVLYGWEPDNAGGRRDWYVLSSRDHMGSFVYNCAIMGC